MVAGTVGTAAAVVTAVASGGAVSAAAVKGNTKRCEAAGVELWNSIAAADDPTTLDATVASSIKERFSGNADAQTGVKQSYSAYLQVCFSSTQLCCASLSAVYSTCIVLHAAHSPV